MYDNNQYNNNQYDNNQMYDYNSAPAQEKGKFIFAVVGFLFPLVGLILFCVWKNNRPGDAKKAGIGALVSTIITVAIVILFNVLWGSVQNTIVDRTCSFFGDTYKATKSGNDWYCVDSVTGDRIKIED